MNTVSVDRTSPWLVSSTEERPPTLEVALLKQTFVFSWNQFVYAEGGDEEVRIAFASHDVIVKGAGLSALLQAVSANKVVSLREPARADRFSPGATRLICEIEVRRVDAD